MFEDLKRLLGETGSREIRLTQSEYDATQHELCQSMAQMLWGEKGLAVSLGSTWFLVMDPRFSACERVWIESKKVTATDGRMTSIGIMEIDDLGNITTPRLISLEQYSEILGEARHYIKVVREFGSVPVNEQWCSSNDPRTVKDWSEEELINLIRHECPNYFTQDGKPNKLAKTWVEMFQADVLGLIMDYAELPNIDQWVLAESGDVVLDQSKLPPETPVAHAEIEYLDRALLFRTILRANTIKVLSKIGGEKLAKMIEGVELTEWAKDEILREVFKYNYDELYKALPRVMAILYEAKSLGFEERSKEDIRLLKEHAASLQGELKSGARKPLDLLEGDASVMSDEGVRFQKISHSENLVALFYMLVQAEGMVKDYPGFKEIVDVISPVIEKAEDISQETFSDLCEQIQALADQAIQDQEVCEEGEKND